MLGPRPHPRVRQIPVKLSFVTSNSVGAATTTESIHNQKMLGRTDAIGPIWCQLLEMANVESVDSIASCILRTAEVESIKF